MSLILEALRRSEAQRRRGQAPGLHTPMPTAAVQRRRGTGPILLALALAVGVGLGLAWTLVPRPLMTTPAAANGPALPPPRLPQSAPLPAPVTPAMAGAGALTRELDAPAVAPTLTPSQAPAPPAIPVPETAAIPPPSVATESPPEAADDVASLPAALRAALPPLRLSMHVYDDDPERRFAIIDGQRVRDGDLLVPGLRVAAIGRDGVRLDWQGRALDLRR
ncbi:MAG: general secretion pathway protein GspB [Lysobacteraceae bacterium]|nr:general secretion pathway protein GspB [Silanimonas sp.]